MIVGVVGLGLMGASFCMALKRIGQKVYGLDISDYVQTYALSNGIIDGALDAKSIPEIDVLVVSVFPESFASAIEKILPRLKKGATVIDFCGTKRKIAKKMTEFSSRYKSVNFVGGHPMAGKEVSGIENACANLFEGASMIFVPVRIESSELQKLKELFLSAGFDRVVETDSENHDAMIAYTSQLCHVVSNAFIKNSTAKKHFGYSAGSYKDMTRVARLDPVMWSELMSENSDKLSAELDELIRNLNDYKVALENNDKQKLKALLTEGNRIKLSIDDKE
ncbi:MAG: prephenate dehydrogenase [Clostridia bacterium]|nr:prephenate dehydrogenase [Clostridia bacterium]